VDGVNPDIKRFVLSIPLLAGLWMLPLSCGNGNKTQPTAPVDENSDGNSMELLGRRFVVDIVSAREETLTTVIIHPSPAQIVAAVILLEGDDGTILLGGTTDDPEIQSEGFLARNADAFASEGFLVALVGAPSDYPGGVDHEYRISAQQSQDVAAVVSWINDRSSMVLKIQPTIWVLGMSLGTYSATNSAIRLNSLIDGFALCSPSTAPTGGPLPNGILDMEIDQIGVLAIIVGHQDDTCPGTPPSGVAAIAN
ncbi:uncharacterized protein METZ01_LOCUS331488, partial [marine metagenome]